VEAGRGERAEGGERRGALFAPLGGSPELAEPAHDAREAGDDGGEAREAGGRPELEPVAVRVPQLAPGIALGDQREGGAKRAEPRSGRRVARPERGRGRSGFDPHRSARVGEEPEEPPEAAAARRPERHRDQRGAEGGGTGERDAPPPAARGEGELERGRRERGEEPGARAGEDEPGEECEPDDRRRREPRDPRLGRAVAGGAAVAVPEPRGRRGERQLEQERQVVRVDEAAAQARGVRHGHTPDRRRIAEPALHAEDHLDERRADESEEERTAHAPRAALERGRGEERRRRGEAEERGAGRVAVEGEADRRGRALAERLGGLARVARVLGRDDARERGRPGEELERAEEDERAERREGAPRAAVEPALASGEERERGDRAGGRGERRGGRARDAAERERREDDEDEERQSARHRVP
jgi:hypothetical protein